MVTDILRRCIDWLAVNRLVNIALITIYFLFIFYMHDPVVHLSVWVMNFFSLPVYNKVVIAIFSLFLILFTVLLISLLNQRRDNLKLKLAYLFITLLMVTVHFRTMFEMNIEIIHIFEFPMLALLLFPLTKRFGATVLLSVPFMLLDEGHQYLVLYPSYIDYFEFNDVLVDIYGCALAMITLFICGINYADEVKPLWKRPEFISLMVALLCLGIALKLCIVSIYAADKCDNTLLVFNRIPGIQSFWRQYPGRDVIYHVMQPLEAFFIIPALTFFYFGLDSFRKPV